LGEEGGVGSKGPSQMGYLGGKDTYPAFRKPTKGRDKKKGLVGGKKTLSRKG